MKKKYRRLGLIAMSVTLLIVGFNALVTAIEVDVEKGLAQSQPKAQLVAYPSGPSAHKADGERDGMRCVPNGHPDAQMMGEVSSDHGLYQIWWYQESDGRFYREVSMAFGDSCAVAYGEQFDAAITNRVPLDIARALTVQFYQSIAEQLGGLEHYRDHMLASFTGTAELENSADLPAHGADVETKPEMSSVDLWALQELGIILPPNTYTVLDIDDAWQYENSI